MADRRNEAVPSQLRASNQDRQAVVDRLQNAFVEGRLQLHEYDERVALAYQAVTYADLAALFADLPSDNPVRPPVARDTADQPAKPVVRHPGVISDMPTALQVIWTIWLCVLLINLTVWTIGAVSQGPQNFWPIWLLVPTSILVGVTAGVTNIRRSRRAKQLRKSLQAARKQRG
jgi:hypothetical protein